MFKFGFGTTGEDSDGGKANDAKAVDAHSDDREAREVVIEGKVIEKDAVAHHLISLCNDEVTMRKAEARAPESLTRSGVDLVPGVYEGGYKLWEGGIDLAEYIYAHHSNDGTFTENTKVLELGAGHGIPGIMAARCGAKHIALHDFNEEVIRDVTAINVAWNVESSINVRYFIGGWNSLAELLQSDAKFDVILSAETVYATLQIQSLAKCIVTLLKPGGVAWVAGKSYYFGVGGGMDEFIHHVGELSHLTHAPLRVDRVAELRNGASNVRQVVQLRRELAEERDG